jgi:hypothetical protein
VVSSESDFAISDLRRQPRGPQRAPASIEAMRFTVELRKNLMRSFPAFANLRLGPLYWQNFGPVRFGLD